MKSIFILIFIIVALFGCDRPKLIKKSSETQKKDQTPPLEMTTSDLESSSLIGAWKSPCLKTGGAILSYRKLLTITAQNCESILIGYKDDSCHENVTEELLRAQISRVLMKGSIYNLFITAEKVDMIAFDFDFTTYLQSRYGFTEELEINTIYSHYFQNPNTFIAFEFDPTSNQLIQIDDKSIMKFSKIE